MKNKKLESGLTEWEDMGWEKEWQRVLEFIRNTFHCNDPTKCIIRTLWPRAPPQETYIVKDKVQFLLNSDFLNIGAILFQTFFPTQTLPKNNTWSVFIYFSMAQFLEDTSEWWRWHPAVLDSSFLPFPGSKSRKYRENLGLKISVI